MPVVGGIAVKIFEHDLERSHFLLDWYLVENG